MIIPHHPLPLPRSRPDSRHSQTTAATYRYCALHIGIGHTVFGAGRFYRPRVGTRSHRTATLFGIGNDKTWQSALAKHDGEARRNIQHVRYFVGLGLEGYDMECWSLGIRGGAGDI